jgi:hypothetical protein
VPNTFLNSRGQYSFIDHIIVDKMRSWPEFVQVNIIHTAKEKKILTSPNWKNNIKSCWNYRENNSDHRVVKFSLKIKISNDYLSKTRKKMKRMLLTGEIHSIKVFTLVFYLKSSRTKKQSS